MFVLSVCMCKWKATNVHPILTIMLNENILRTLEAGVLKLFRRRFASVQALDVLIKKSV